MIIKKQLIPSSKYSIKAPYTMKPEYITVHNTYNDASAQAEINYMTRNSNATSFHIAVDDKEAIQAIPYNRNAWHSGDSSRGDGNRKSIGIEICYSKSGGSRYEKAEDNAAKVVAQLLKEHKLGIDRVKTHQHWTKIGKAKGYSSYVKNCPHRILDRNGWNGFINQVKKELERLEEPAAKPAAKPKPDLTVVEDTIYRVRKSATDAKTQISAFKSLESAKRLAERTPGYKVYDHKGKLIYTPSVVYTVKRGDRLSKIAERYKTTVKKLQDANNIKDANKIFPGQKIKIK